MRLPARALTLMAPFAGLLLASDPARAEVTKDRCIDANASAQDLRRDGKLSLARAELRVCSDPGCPALVQRDCVKRIEELEAVQPTVVFEAKDGAGGDLARVTVSMDGKPFSEGLSGVALAVDPGPHVFTFAVAGAPPVTRTIVVTEGEKGRHERVVLGAPPPVIAPATWAPAPAAPTYGTQRTFGLVSGGVGVVGLILGGVFGGLALAERSQEKQDCTSNTCGAVAYQKAENDRSSGVTDGTVSTVGFIAGGVLVAGGAALFFTAPRSSERASSSALRVSPSIAPAGAGLVMSGAF